MRWGRGRERRQREREGKRKRERERGGGMESAGLSSQVCSDGLAKVVLFYNTREGERVSLVNKPLSAKIRSPPLPKKPGCTVYNGYGCGSLNWDDFEQE